MWLRWCRQNFLRIGISVFGLCLVSVFAWYMTVVLIPTWPIVYSDPVPIEMISVDEEVVELPQRLIIPAIQVDANVQLVGLDHKGGGGMGVPTNFTDVGWYMNGVLPGQRGSAVMAGHYNGKRTPRAVFFDLSTLSIGDEVIVVSGEQATHTFRVVQVVTYEYDAPTAEVFVSHDGKRRLNLITCSGNWIAALKLYSKRTVVFTELVTDGT